MDKKKLVDFRLEDIGALENEMDTILKELFPINRSITGDGVRETYRILNQIAEFDVKEISSGRKCFDWIVPEEWEIKEAYIENERGERIVDFRNNNLHVLNYSISVDRTVDYKELAEHIHTLPELPEAIPYRTSYYKRDWGFCMAYKQFRELDKNRQYKVFIDAKYKSDGSLTLGEYLQGGISRDEYMISTYSCHPSLANDNLSGMVLWAFLLRIIQGVKTRHNYRFCIWPETIGAIAYLSIYEKEMSRIKGGFVVTTVGGIDSLGYKPTFLGDSKIDRAVFRAFKKLGIKPILYRFEPSGSDERQLSSPGFRIPVGTITKGKYGEYPFYHTSLDDLNYVKAKNIIKTLSLYLASLQELEADIALKSNFLFCEPNLGKRGLYPTIGGAVNTNTITSHDLDIIRWVMFYADGINSLQDIYEKTGFPHKDINRVVDLLIEKGMISYAR